MTALKLTPTQINALKAAEADPSGKLVKFNSLYWCANGHNPKCGDVIPDQKTTFGTKTINSLDDIGLLLKGTGECGKFGATITDAGRQSLAKIKEAAQ